MKMNEKTREMVCTIRGQRISAQKSDYTALFRAASSALKRYQGGAEAFANLMGRNPSTVRNCFNPLREEMPPLILFLQMIEQTADPVVMNALCDLAGGKFIPDEEAEASGDLIAGTFDYLRNAGESIAVISEALRDGKLSPNERAECFESLDGVRHQINTVISLLAKAEG